MPLCTQETMETYRDLWDKVLFVGSAVGMDTKVMLPQFLHAAAEAASSGDEEEGQVSSSSSMETEEAGGVDSSTPK